MIWLTWRQFRAQAITAAAALAAFAILLARRSHLSSLYDSSGLRTYPAAPAPGWPASSFSTSVGRLPHRSAYISCTSSGPVILIAPAIIGTFWGAPLIARELETGTFRCLEPEHHPNPVAGGQARADRGSPGRDRGVQPYPGLVGGPHRQSRRARRRLLDFSEGRFGWLSPPRHHPARLRRVGFASASPPTSLRRPIPAMAITLASSPPSSSSPRCGSARTSSRPARRPPPSRPREPTSVSAPPPGWRSSPASSPASPGLDHLQRRRQRRRAAGQHHPRGLRRYRGHSARAGRLRCSPREQLRSQPRGRRLPPASHYAPPFGPVLPSPWPWPATASGASPPPHLTTARAPASRVPARPPPPPPPPSPCTRLESTRGRKILRDHGWLPGTGDRQVSSRSPPGE